MPGKAARAPCCACSRPPGAPGWWAIRPAGVIVNCVAPGPPGCPGNPAALMPPGPNHNRYFIL
jgi:hypothetical protein